MTREDAFISIAKSLLALASYQYTHGRLSETGKKALDDAANIMEHLTTDVRVSNQVENYVLLCHQRATE